MDIKRLKQFITLSNEDFADAHEPVNDGVKDVPDASDIAKMVTRSGGSGESDLTTQGEGKVIPEKPDTDETPEKKDPEHTEVKEEEGTGPGGQDDSQPKVKAPVPEKKEPDLAHDTVERVDTDEEITTEEKESFEFFSSCEAYQTEIVSTMRKIEELEVAAVAVEQFRQLLNDNKGRVSKQAAAIIQTSLEHIDLTCELRARTTGLESFDTSPRSALESVDVDSKTLNDRTSELGAKIMKVLKMLWDKAMNLYTKFNAGITKLDHSVSKLAERVGALKVFSEDSEVDLDKVSPNMFMDGEFVGDHITDDEVNALKDIQDSVKYIYSKGITRVAAELRNGEISSDGKERVDGIIDGLNARGGFETLLPGGYDYSRKGVNVSLTHEDTNAPDKHSARLLEQSALRRNVAELSKYLKSLNNNIPLDLLKKGSKALTDSVVEFRKRAKGAEGFSEEGFQEVQNELINGLIKPLDLSKYVSLITDLARLVGPRVYVLNAIVSKHESGKGE